MKVKVEFELSKYDIIGMASLIGASKEKIEKVDVYINGLNEFDIDCIKDDDEYFGSLKALFSSLVIKQISEKIGL